MPRSSNGYRRLEFELRRAGLARAVKVGQPFGGRGRAPAVVTMWEADQLPQPIIKSLRRYDTVVVPSQFCAELFGRYHQRVVRVPLGIDPQAWGLRPRPALAPGGQFVFLAAGTGLRKGLDLVERAFDILYGEWAGGRIVGPEPHLKLQTLNEGLGTQGRTFIREHLSDQAEVELYASAHCFVAASRGEGWGMTPHQAIAQGCPTILTAAHGQADFTRWGIGVPAHKAPVTFPEWSLSCRWWEPDFAALMQAMLAVYADYNHYRAAAARASEAARTWTWTDCAAAINQVLTT